MDIPKSFDISPIGYVHSTFKERSGAPRQGWEGAPNARLEIHPAFVQGLDGIKSGQDIWIFTWLPGWQEDATETLVQLGSGRERRRHNGSPDALGIHE